MHRRHITSWMCREWFMFVGLTVNVLLWLMTNLLQELGKVILYLCRAHAVTQQLWKQLCVLCHSPCVSVRRRSRLLVSEVCLWSLQWCIISAETIWWWSPCCALVVADTYVIGWFFLTQTLRVREHLKDSVKPDKSCTIARKLCNAVCFSYAQW